MKNKISLIIKSRFTGILSFGVALFALAGCVETIDDSNAVINKRTMMSEYFEENPDYSHIKSIFDRVRLKVGTAAAGAEASSITSVLGSRGNYTCFAPTNAAVEAYALKLNGTADVSALTYEQAELVAYSCLIDNGDEAAYETPDFSSSGSFGKSNFYDRVLTYDMDSEGTYTINQDARIITPDIEVENGMIHVVDRVVAPSSQKVWDLFNDAPNMKIMARLFKETGWAGAMTEEVDNNYKSPTELMSLNDGDIKDVKVVQNRYLGFTVFVEPDDVLVEKWTIPAPEFKDGEIQNWDGDGGILAALTKNCKQAYPNATDPDLTSPNNALNRFVAYHILKGRIPHDRFNNHWNEYRYGYGKDALKPQKDTYPIDVWDYYVTAGEYPEMLKVTQVGHNDKGMENDLYLNRVTKHDQKNYNELSVVNPGVVVAKTNDVKNELGKDTTYTNNAKNGYYYPINDVLVCNSTIKGHLSSERIRFDFVTIQPEMASCNLRSTDYWAFPNDFFENIINVSNDTKIFYLRQGQAYQWRDYQGDEYLFGGVYDFTIKLPPPPRTETYEIRMGVSTNGRRGMAQLYFADDPNQLTPVGLPFDMRLNAQQDSNIPWADDKEKDDDFNRETDKAMRNSGYMKAPLYFTVASPDGTHTLTDEKMVRKNSAVLRRIITTEELKENQHYYLRVKSALVKTDSELFIDYFEYVPSTVYNGTEGEDQW